MEISNAEFIISNTDVKKCPAGHLPEYAFIGRSNVGKSSLINMLTGRKGLAMTSATPGKTMLINHFLINDSWYIVDLPGYGCLLYTSRFTSMVYNPVFHPDGNNSEGRFLMSAVYENIHVTKGGSEQVPVTLPLPTSKVELIRAMAKVEVIFRKKVSGSILSDHAITSVRLKNVASNLSVPPYDNYYLGDRSFSLEASLSELDYQNDSVVTCLLYTSFYYYIFWSQIE